MATHSQENSTQVAIQAAREAGYDRGRADERAVQRASRDVREGLLVLIRENPQGFVLNRDLEHLLGETHA